MNNYFLILIFSVLIASFSQILLKKSTHKKYTSFIKEYINPYVITGYILFFISTILTVLSLSHLEYKNVPVIESLGYIFVLLLSFIFLKEKITKHKIIGNLLILLGIIIFYI